MIKLIGHTKDVRSVAFVPDGRLVSGGSDKVVIVWDSLRGNVLERIDSFRVIYAVAVSPDSSLLAFSGRPFWAEATINHVEFWDLKRDTSPAISWAGAAMSSTVSVGSVWSTSFSGDGKLVAAASRPDGQKCAVGRLWKVADFYDGLNHFRYLNRMPLDYHLTGSPLDNRDDEVYTVAFARTGQTLATSRRSKVVIRDLYHDRARTTIPIRSRRASALAFVPGEETLVIAAASTIYLATTRQSAKPLRVRTKYQSITSVAVSPDGRSLVVGRQPGLVEFYDLKTLSLRTSLDLGIGKVHSVAFSPDGCTFAAGGDKGLMVCDVP